MKAQTKVCTARRCPELGVRTPPLMGPRTPTTGGESEMQACFHKLKQLVPTVPHDRKVSKVALLQHVIDYILDLEVTLDFKPSEESAKLLRTALEQSAAAAAATTRKPLSESSSRINTTHSLQVRSG
ncbi:hypothetical protein NP493_62g02007 [Ridgeia piscesae]|uniref:BHLH domain-containing protein n=1 Tax=Ridgeia piscesae TaxID=27915 RepID=A0AAD9UJ03_RIDPI|nr:hypothetical protein NP493_62g02007 [Ridgeia piscesae]